MWWIPSVWEGMINFWSCFAEFLLFPWVVQQVSHISYQTSQGIELKLDGCIHYETLQIWITFDQASVNSCSSLASDRASIFRISSNKLLRGLSSYLIKVFVVRLQAWLTHWGRVTHICVSDLTSIGSDNGLSPGRRQAIIRTNAGKLLIRPFGTNFSEILIEIIIFSFKKMRLKVSSGKRRPCCLGLNVLTSGHASQLLHIPEQTAH